jgi:hypothetical protein
MILQQFYLNCLAHASYLVGDEKTHTAAVIDPQRDVDQYFAFATAHGLAIKHVLLTHFHAIAQLEMAGDEVGMEVREKDMPDPEAFPGGIVKILSDVALRIHNGRDFRFLVGDQVRCVRETAEVVLFKNHCASIS